MHYFTRFKLILLCLVAFIFSPTAWALYDGLSGTWYHDGQSTYINRNGFNQYSFCNENRDCANGFLTSQRNILVPKWSVNGILDYQNRAIQWSNGTKWVRYPNTRINMARTIDGQWFHSGQPTRIQMNRNNNKFFLTNELGQTSWGYIQGNTLTIPSLNIVGFLSRGGSQIRWSNNTVWDR